MKRPIFDRLTPETSGFNRPRIAAASAVVLITLGAVTYLLTRGAGEPIVRPEPPVVPTTHQPPRELLEEPPELARAEPPPILRPSLEPFIEHEATPSETVPEPRISPRVQKAFQGISYTRHQQRSPSSTSQRPNALPPELTTIFRDLEEQNRALGEFLQQPPAALSTSSFDQLNERLQQENPTRRPQREPVTRHQAVDVRYASGNYLLRQGTVIPAQLLTEINSDLPGQVLAHVLTDIRDSLSFRALLLPRGTKLIGSYSSGLGTGQNRLAVAWTRLLLPDGGSIELGEMPAVDRQGRSGLHDRVNHHTGRIFGNALLLSLLSAGFEAAQPSSDQLRLSAGELAVEGASRELERAASELLRRNASIPPTVTIRAGTAFNVFLTGDLTFQKPYRP